MNPDWTSVYATVKYNTDGIEQWSMRYDGHGSVDVGNAIAVDGSGNVYVTGISLGWDWIISNTIKYVQPVGVDPDVLPESYMLSQNYPNPLKLTTTISLSLPAESEVELTVYNIKGQKVKTVINENYSKGTHLAMWDGKDENGKLVPSGIYFYKMSTSGYTSTKKMILMK